MRNARLFWAANMLNKTLVFLTSSFPFGKHEAFIENEIGFLAAKFERVIVITNDTTSSEARTVPANVTVLRRSYHLAPAQKLVALLCIFKVNFWKEIWFLHKTFHLFPTLKILATALASMQKAQLLRSFFIENISLAKDEKFVAYAYWSDDNAVDLCWLKSSFPNMKVACRAHRWDVYFDEKNGDYLPFRWVLHKQVDALFFISEHARNFFTSKHQFSVTSNLRVSRLGTLPLKPAGINVEKHYRIVSCSSVIARKRVLLLAESIAKLNLKKKVLWTHFGDGNQMDELRSFSVNHLSKTEQVEVTLAGNVSNKSVRDFYEANAIDVFVNVSASEGVPVSIMEAMSAGIPVIATNVDAVNEIVVDGLNGKLLPANPSADEVAAAIQSILEMDENATEKCKQQTLNFWNAKYNAAQNYTQFIDDLERL